MACNGRVVWEVYCCFVKLLMTCVLQGLRAQSECKTTECWEKWWRVEKNCEKGENERERLSHLPSSITYINAFMEDRVEGEGAVIWRWHQWCHQPLSCLTPFLQAHIRPLSSLRHYCNKLEVSCNGLYRRALPTSNPTHTEKPRVGCS